MKGETVSIGCKANGYPEPRVYWTKEDVEVHPSAYISVSDTLLTLHSVNMSDEGHYACIAENLAGSSKDRVSFFVHGI